jgi:hypothetical protein
MENLQKLHRFIINAVCSPDLPQGCTDVKSNLYDAMLLVEQMIASKEYPSE